MTIYCGQRFIRPYLLSSDEAGTVPIDVTGYTMIAKIRDMNGVLFLSTQTETTAGIGGAGGEIVDSVVDPAGIMQLLISPSSTGALQTNKFTTGRYTVSIVDGSANEIRIENGIVVADWEVSN